MRHTIHRPERSKQESRAIIEKVNGRSPSGVSLLAIGRQQGLVIQGWVNMPHMQLWHSVPFFLSLRPENDVGSNNETRLIASIHDRYVRTDIPAESVGNSHYWCGFSVTSVISNVAPGRYTLELLAADTNSLDSAVAARTDLTLIIG